MLRSRRLPPAIRLSIGCVTSSANYGPAVPERDFRPTFLYVAVYCNSGMLSSMLAVRRKEQERSPGPSARERGCSSEWLQCIGAVADERRLPRVQKEKTVVSVSELLGGPEGQRHGA